MWRRFFSRVVTAVLLLGLLGSMLYAGVYFYTTWRTDQLSERLSQQRSEAADALPPEPSPAPGLDPTAGGPNSAGAPDVAGDESIGTNAGIGMNADASGNDGVGTASATDASQSAAGTQLASGNADDRAASAGAGNADAGMNADASGSDGIGTASATDASQSAAGTQLASGNADDRAASAGAGNAGAVLNAGASGSDGVDTASATDASRSAAGTQLASGNADDRAASAGAGNAGAGLNAGASGSDGIGTASATDASQSAAGTQLASGNADDRAASAGAGNAGADTAEAVVPEAAADDPLLRYYRDLAVDNPDMIGWISIPDTPVDYPVMFSPEEPQFYLSRDFNRNYTFEGIPFLDERCDANAPSDNLIVYGHNMRSGRMFGSLSKYRDADYRLEHPLISFDTLDERRVYRVYAGFVVQVSGDPEDADMVCYRVDLTSDEEQLQALLDFVSDHALFVDPELAPELHDQLLTLSTCTSVRKSERFILMAIRVE